MPKIEVHDEINWDPQPILRPGMDHRAGVTYFTVPLLRTVLLPPKKKGAEPTMAKMYHTYVVSSEREGIWYEKDALEVHGFMADEQLVQESQSRWSLPSVRAFLETDLSGPTSKKLFQQIRKVYTTYVEFADEAYYDLMSLYVMYTYVFRLLEHTGYLHFNGTMASGKSRNLSILNAIAFNTIWASSMSAAALYRKLAGAPGTTCFDETEGFEGERGEELRRILNAGYKDGSRVARAEKGPNDRFQTVMFDVFGPKALASINALDNVISSRCLIVNMRPAIRELPDFLASNAEWADLRDSLYLWAMDNTEALAALVAAWLDTSKTGKKNRLCPRLIGRQWETTAQYIILADYVGGETFVSKVVEFFNAYFTKQQEALDATDRIRTTLRCLPRVLDTKTPTAGNLYAVKDIHDVVASYMEADSTEYFKTKHVTKNLDTLGFKHKVRASGGLRVRLDEAAVRHEFAQRRIEPFDEDTAWLRGETSYQTPTGLFDTPTPPPEPEPSMPWWDLNDDGPDLEALSDG